MKSLVLVSALGFCVVSGAAIVEVGNAAELSAVVEKIRVAEAGGEKSIEVVLAPGDYRLAAPIELKGLGKSGAVIVWKSAQPARPAVISGARRIEGWRKGEDGSWRVVLPEVRDRGWKFSQLYVDGVRRWRPRLPRIGFLRTISNAFVNVEAKTVGGFAFRTGDIPENLANRSDVELGIVHQWNMTVAKIGAVDAATGIVRFMLPRRSVARQHDFTNRRYYLDNVKEAFGDPGEWYLDRSTGELGYMPMPGEKMEEAVVTAPATECLFRIADCRGLRFENLVLEGAGYNVPDAGHFAAQADYTLPGMVQVADSAGIVFDRCTARHTGGYAFVFDHGASGCAVRSSLMHDLGGGGVMGGAFAVGTGTLTNGSDELTVENCRITDGGHVSPGAVGVLIGWSSRNKVIHNEIDHLYYTGISCGWGWSEAKPAKMRDNEIAFNHVHHIGQGLLSDMGLVYLLSRQPGTTVHDNYLHNISCGDYGATGLYPDEGSSEMKIYNNVVMNAGRLLHQNYGQDNEIFNNFFVNSRQNVWDFRPNVPRFQGDVFNLHHNVFVWRRGTFMQRGWPFGMPSGRIREMAEKFPYESGHSSSSNVYWNLTGEATRFGQGRQRFSVFEWQRRGKEIGSYFGEPGFVGDVFNGDFRLDPESPAAKLGIRSPEVAAAGIVKTAGTPALPQVRNQSCGLQPQLSGTVRVGFIGGREPFAKFRPMLLKRLSGARKGVKFVAEADPLKANLVYCLPGGEVEKAVAEFRARSNAGLVLFTAPLNRDECTRTMEYYLRGDETTARLAALAVKCNCCFIDLRHEWAKRMSEEAWKAEDLLTPEGEIDPSKPGPEIYLEALAGI